MRPLLAREKVEALLLVQFHEGHSHLEYKLILIVFNEVKDVRHRLRDHAWKIINTECHLSSVSRAKKQSSASVRLLLTRYRQRFSAHNKVPVM